MAIPCSWTHADSDEALRVFLSQEPPRRAAIRYLMKELLSGSRFDRRCAADLARLVSAREPGVLRAYADVFIDMVAELPLEEWQARGYLTLAAAHSAATRKQRITLAALVRALAVDERNALRAIALEAFGILAMAEPELRDEAMELLERGRREGTCAMRSRATRMLPQLLAAELEQGSRKGSVRR
jgi:hypothetical protein